MTDVPPDLAAALAGRFTLGRELGRGGMGVVYLARERALDRDVALKVLPPALAAQADLRERFLREARTAAGLSHPNIVPVFSADETGGFAWFAMGFVDGESLGQRLAARGRLGPADAVRILREAAWALAYAHARGVVHRDVKPDNLLIERADGRTLVTDFGIARQAKDVGLTADGHVLGTVQFMSPEQVNAAPLDGRSDLYALGVVGFLMLAGRLPFTETQASAVLVAHATKPAPPLASVAPDVPASLCAVIDRCLSKDPAGRYATGEALADALAAALEAEAAPGRTPSSVPSVLSTGQAEQVWLRAAQLQMDAATAIRRRAMAEPVLSAPSTGLPTSGFRRSDVEAAAAEVGIGREFVQLAMAELSEDGGAMVPTDAEDARLTRELGTAERSVRVSRVIEASPAAVLAAFGEVAMRPPFRLTLVDTVGGHPLDGGVLRLAVPRGNAAMIEDGVLNMFVYRMTQLELEHLSVALHPLSGSPARTEIVVTGDLRSGARRNAVVSERVKRWLGGTVGVGMAGIGGGVAVAQGALVAAGLFVGGGVVAGAALMWLARAAQRAMYRGALTASVEQLDGLLVRVGSAAQSRALFGQSSSPPPRQGGSGDGWSAFGAMLGALVVAFVVAPAPAALAQAGAACAVAPTVLDAGGFHTVTYTVTAGPGGFAKGGGVRLELPVAYAETEALLWSPPQAEQPTEPGFVEATVFAGSRSGSPVPVVVEGLLRGIVRAEFATPVPAGARVIVRYRGQVQGLSGEVEARCQMRAHAGDAWSPSAPFPRLTVRPARAEFVTVHHPSDVARGTPFDAALVILDRYGNRATGHTGTITLRTTDSAARLPARVTLRAADSGRVVIRGVTFGTVGFQKIMAADPASRLRPQVRYAMVGDGEPALRRLFGDLHFHTGSGAERPGFLSADVGTDVNTTATGTFKELNLAGDHRANFTRATDAYGYARDVAGLDFASASEHASSLLTPVAWRRVQDIADAAYVPGRFTTFYGFEWTPDLDHHVVLYADRAGRPLGHDRHPDYPALARALEAQGVAALAIPHVSWPFPRHILWRDTVGRAWQRVGELYSLWNSRHLVQPDDDPQLFELGADAPWSFQHAWRGGRRMGVIAASDNHLGHPGANNLTVRVRHAGGLAAVLAPRNDRADVWRALTARHTYATTGTPIYLDFNADGHPMGSEYASAAAPTLTGRVAGTNRLARVEVVRLSEGGYQTVFRAEPDAETFRFAFTDDTRTGAAMYYLRVTQVEEYPGRLYAHSTAEMAWSSPIWVDPPRP